MDISDTVGSHYIIHSRIKIPNGRTEDIPQMELHKKEFNTTEATEVLREE